MRFFLLLVPVTSLAQSPNTQLWFEYMLNYPFANTYNLENAFTYSTLLEEPRWRAFDYSPTIEYSLTRNVDLTVGGTFSFTVQNENYNTFEIRPVVGSRIHLTPNKRVLIRVLLRLEQRNFLNLDTDEWENLVRPRIRAESLIPLNKQTYFEDGVWYIVTDAEWLFSGDEVGERFANRFRARVGLGHRLAYSSRFEFIYMSQQSKSGLNEDFSSSDNIFRLRYKHFLRKGKPAKMTGTGN